MDTLEKAIEILKDAIDYSVRNMDEVTVNLEFQDADVILELLEEYKEKRDKINEHIKKAIKHSDKICDILCSMVNENDRNGTVVHSKGKSRKKIEFFA